MNHFCFPFQEKFHIPEQKIIYFSGFGTIPSGPNTEITRPPETPAPTPTPSGPHEVQRQGNVLAEHAYIRLFIERSRSTEEQRMREALAVSGLPEDNPVRQRLSADIPNQVARTIELYRTFFSSLDSLPRVSRPGESGSQLSPAEEQRQFNEWMDNLMRAIESVENQMESNPEGAAETVVNAWFSPRANADPQLKEIFKDFIKNLIIQENAFNSAIREEKARLSLSPAFQQTIQTMRGDLATFPTLYAPEAALASVSADQRNAILAWRQAVDRIRNEDQQSPAPAAGAETAPRETPERTADTRGERRKEFWKELVKFFSAIALALGVKSPEDIQGVLDALEEMDHPERRRRPEREPLPPIGRLFSGQEKIEPERTGNGIRVKLENPSDLLSPTDGRVTNVTANPDGTKTIDFAILLASGNPQGTYLHFIVPPNNNLPSIATVFRKGDTLVAGTRGVTVKIDERVGVTQRGEPTYNALSDDGIVRFFGDTFRQSEERRGTVREETPAAEVPEQPRERQQAAQRLFREVENLAKQALQNQQADVAKTAVNALRERLRRLWRELPPDPNRELFVNFRREVQDLKRRLQAWEEYPRIAEQARSQRVSLRDVASVEAYGQDGDRAREDIVNYVESLKQALQQAGRTRVQTPSPAGTSMREGGPPLETPSTSRERLRSAEDMFTGIRGLLDTAKGALHAYPILREAARTVFQSLESKFNTLRRDRDITPEEHTAFINELRNTSNQLLAFRDYPDLITEARRRNIALPQNIQELTATNETGPGARQNVVALVDELRTLVQPQTQTAQAGSSGTPPSTPGAPAASPAAVPPAANPNPPAPTPS